MLVATRLSQHLSLGLLIFLLASCTIDSHQSLDKSIPRLETPTDRIAFLRTKWMNGRHIETVFYDHQNRVLEVYSFGRTNFKWLHHYVGDRLTTSIYYYHSDSSEPGYINIDTLQRSYNQTGRLILERHQFATQTGLGNVKTEGYSSRYLAYSPQGDTLIRKKVNSYRAAVQDSSQLANVSRWERDASRRLSRFYRLYVFKQSRLSKNDTIHHYSQQFAYDRQGRLKMAWYDSMYLGRFYLAAGPDTIWYRYNATGQLVEERHRYTIDRRNKREIVREHLSAYDRNEVDQRKKRFFEGDGIFPSNDHTDLVQYHYEAFDPAKHTTLSIPGW